MLDVERFLSALPNVWRMLRQKYATFLCFAFNVLTSLFAFVPSSSKYSLIHLKLSNKVVKHIYLGTLENNYRKY